MMTLISWVNRIYGSQGLATLSSKSQLYVIMAYIIIGCVSISQQWTFLYKCCRFLFAGSLIYPRHNGIKKYFV